MMPGYDGPPQASTEKGAGILPFTGVSPQGSAIKSPFMGSAIFKLYLHPLLSQLNNLEP
jgi:hypothetical protein